jgi:heme-binding protein
MKTTTAALRHGLLGVLTAAALGGAATANLTAPSATGATDPCAASEMARTVGSVAKSAGDYLDSHPETNQAMTTVLQQPAGPQSVTSLKSYFEANPKVAGDMQKIADPLTGLATKCKLPISIPQALGFMQGAQGGVPGGLPVGLPGGGPAGQPVAGAPVSGPAAGAAPGNAPASTGPLPGQATAPQTAIR